VTIRINRAGALAIFGIAVPAGIVSVADAFRQQHRGDDTVLQWTVIVAAFWCIAGVIATGVQIIRDALKRAD
jgi:hypothetical protein